MSHVLQLQLAATIDVSKLFAQIAYVVEGNCKLVADAYDHLQELSFTMAGPSYPNTLAVAKKLAGDNQAQVLIHMTLSRGDVNAIRYFHRRMNHQDDDFLSYNADVQGGSNALPQKGIQPEH